MQYFGIPAIFIKYQFEYPNFHSISKKYRNCKLHTGETLKIFNRAFTTMKIEK